MVPALGDNLKIHTNYPDLTFKDLSEAEILDQVWGNVLEYMGGKRKLHGLFSSMVAVSLLLYLGT